MTDRETEQDEVVATLSEAGLITIEIVEGRVSHQLAVEGARVVTQTAMSGEDDAAAPLDALLDARKLTRSAPSLES